MKIAEEIGDKDQKETAKVNFGMANANLKWDKKQSEILDIVNVNQLDVKATVNVMEDPDEQNEEEDEFIDGNEATEIGPSRHTLPPLIR